MFFGSFCCFCLPFCHPVGGRDSLKKRKIHQECVCVGLYVCVGVCVLVVDVVENLREVCMSFYMYLCVCVCV